MPPIDKPKPAPHRLPQVTASACRRAMLAWPMLLAFAGDALAHAALAKAEPTRRSTLSKSPRQIRLWFNERLEPAYGKITLLKDDSLAIALAPTRVDKADPRLLVVDLPELAPGNYTVQYRVLSVDGHTVDSGYTFTVKAAAD